jgi:sterol desaturase/sphingolipid hydroxylase (fatty acid hydroxylase superfamily)
MFVDLFYTHFAVFWTLSGVFFTIDLFYSLTKQHLYDWKAYGQAARCALSLQAGVHYPLSCLCDLFCPFPETTFSNWDWWWQLPTAVIITDFFFYYSHRLLHIVPFLYKKIHHHHHKWNIPVAVAALDTHPIEHVFVNILPIFLGLILARVNFRGCVLYTLLATANTVCVHSGVQCLADGHDLHHCYRNVNYGTGFYLFDRLHATKKSYVLHLKTQIC